MVGQLKKLNEQFRNGLPNFLKPWLTQSGKINVEIAEPTTTL